MRYLLLLLVVVASCTEPATTSFKASLTMPSGNQAIVENGTLDTVEYVSSKVTRYMSYSADSSYVIRHKYMKPVVPPVEPPVVVPPVNNGYSLFYSNGFDKKSDISDNQLGKGYFTTEFFKSGTGSFKSIVSTGDPSISSGWRSEQQYSSGPKEGYIQFDIWIDSWQNENWGASCFQFHPGNQDNKGSALYFMEVCQQKWNTYDWKRGYQTSYGSPSTINAKQWYKFRLEYNWSRNSDGYFKTYIDGKLYNTFTGVTQISNDFPYAKLGQNHFSSSSGSGSPHGMVIYYDNFEWGAKN